MEPNVKLRQRLSALIGSLILAGIMGSIIIHATPGLQTVQMPTTKNPAGGEPLVVRERVSPMTNRYALESPPVRGVEAGKPYRVSIRVLDRLERDVLWTSTLDIKSQISDDVVPDEPLTIGPGYHRPLKRG